MVYRLIARIVTIDSIENNSLMSNDLDCVLAEAIIISLLFFLF